MANLGDTGGSAEERKAAKTSPAKRALTNAQMSKAFANRNIEAGKFKTNVINKAKELGVTTEVAFKKLITQMLKGSEKLHKESNKLFFGKRDTGGRTISNRDIGGRTISDRDLKKGGSVKKYAKGGGVRKARYK